jgi:hypothetical protein
MRIDRQVRTRDARSFLVAPMPRGATIVGTATDGDAAFVSWRHSEGIEGTRVHLARIDVDATVTTLSDSVPIAGTAISMLVSNGYVLFLGSDRGALTVTLLDRSGVVVRSGVPFLDPAATTYEPAIVATGTGSTFVIGWIGNDRRVHTTAILLADILANRVPIQAVPSVTKGSARWLRLASNGAHTMAFWYEDDTLELRSRSLGSTGVPLDPAPVTVGSFRLFEAPTAIALDGGYELLFRQYAGGNLQMVSLRAGFDGTLQSVRRNGPLTVGWSFAAAQKGDLTIAVWVEHRYAAGDYNAGWQVVASSIANDASIGEGTLLSLDLPVQHVRKLLPFKGGGAALWLEDAPNARLVIGRLTALGKPLDGAGLRLRESPYDQSGSAITTNGEQLVVVWTEGEPSQPQALYEAIVSPGDSLSVSVRQLASDAGGDNSDAGISWNGQTFTITYRRVFPNHTYDFAALRTDRSGNVIDPAPVSLMPARADEVSPRIATNGGDALLLWARRYEASIGIPERPPCWITYPPVNEYFAQRFNSALAPVGAPIALATTGTHGLGADVSFSGGLWLVSWMPEIAYVVVYARIDGSGRRLDPLDGRFLCWNAFLDVAFLAATPSGWLIASRSHYPLGFKLASIGFDGASTDPAVVLIPGISSLEAFALIPHPIMAYKRSPSTAAYVDILLPHLRTVRH